MTHKHLNIPFSEEVLAFATKEHQGFEHDQQVFLDTEDYESWIAPDAPLVEGYVKIKCGTKACVAGIAALIHPDVTIPDNIDDLPRLNGREASYQSIARRLMGLTESQSDRLFLDTCQEEDPEQAAVELLKQFIETAKQEQGVNV